MYPYVAPGTAEIHERDRRWLDSTRTDDRERRLCAVALVRGDKSPRPLFRCN